MSLYELHLTMTRRPVAVARELSVGEILVEVDHLPHSTDCRVSLVFEEGGMRRTAVEWTPVTETKMCFCVGDLGQNTDYKIGVSLRFAKEFPAFWERQR